MSHPIRYRETQDPNGKWYAQQDDIDLGRYRRSADRYDSREDLFTTMAFGRHEWGKWVDVI